MKLFVAGLPYDFDDTDFKEMFELYGEVNSAKVALDRETRKSRGFGFLDMPNDAEARDAMQAMNGAKLKGGKQLAVKEAEEQPARPGGFNNNRRPDNRFDNRNDSRGDFRDRRRY